MVVEGLSDSLSEIFEDAVFTSPKWQLLSARRQSHHFDRGPAPSGAHRQSAPPCRVGAMIGIGGASRLRPSHTNVYGGSRGYTNALRSKIRTCVGWALGFMHHRERFDVFAVLGPLVRHSRLLPDFCPSTCTFAVRFLQTSPRGDSPCAVANPSPPSGWVGRDRDTARATLGQGLAVSAFPRYVPV